MNKTTPFIYREEALKPFFDHVKSGESFYLIGAPSAGKTRFLDLVLGHDPDAQRIGDEYDRDWVKKKYLGEDAGSKVWLVRVDMNRIAQEGNWGFQFYELLLYSILLACNQNRKTEKIDTIINELTDLDSKIVTSKDELMAYRLLEIAINRICQIYKIRLCFLFDEFDETYRTMPLKIFAQLRAIRDANKYQVSYGLFLRDLPEKLRSQKEHESFFELISSRMIGLGFYSKRDTFSIIEKWEIRHEHRLSADQKEWLWEQSGGHPGVAHVLFTLITETPTLATKIRDAEWFACQDTVHEEFRKIFEGLSKEEQTAMHDAKGGRQNFIPDLIGRQLLSKGLVKRVNSHVIFFSPMFSIWLK